MGPNGEQYIIGVNLVNPDNFGTTEDLGGVRGLSIGPDGLTELEGCSISIDQGRTYLRPEQGEPCAITAEVPEEQMAALMAELGPVIAELEAAAQAAQAALDDLRRERNDG